MNLIAMCGLDCEGCDAHRATRAEDQEAKERIAARWREEGTPMRADGSVDLSRARVARP